MCRLSPQVRDLERRPQKPGLNATYIPYATSPEQAAEVRLPRKYIENREVLSSRLYQRVMVNNPAGMKPASHNLRLKSASCSIFDQGMKSDIPEEQPCNKERAEPLLESLEGSH